jgi:hypothetical protein
MRRSVKWWSDKTTDEDNEFGFQIVVYLGGSDFFVMSFSWQSSFGSSCSSESCGGDWFGEVQIWGLAGLLHC